MEHLPDSEASICDLGNSDDFQRLFERFYSPLCNYAFALLHHDQDAEDVVQSLFIELWEKRSKISLPAEPRFFLLRATKNRAVDQLRRRTQAAKITHAFAEMPVEYADEPPFHAEEQPSSLTDLLPFAIEQLPPKTREVLLMSRQQEKSYKEIAATLDISVKTVENQIGRAFRLLRAFFGEQR